MSVVLLVALETVSLLVAIGNSLPPFGVDCGCVLDWLVADDGGMAVGVVSTNGDTGTGVGAGGLEAGGGVLGLGGLCS